MNSLPLARIRVIDCAQGLSGSVAAAMLAQGGADVIKVEPRGGNPARDSVAYSAWNRGKQSIALDLKHDYKDLAALLSGAEVLIHEPGFPEAVLADAPHLITCCVRSLPEPLDQAGLPADDFLIMAATGLIAEQPATNREGPSFVQLSFGSWCAAWLAAIGVAARLVDVQQSGASGPADTSVMQGLLVPAMMLWREHEHGGEALDSRIDKRVLPAIFECGDGVWLHIMKNADDTPLMKQLLGEMGEAGVAAANAEWPQHFRYTNWGANVRAFRSRSSAEWLEDLWEADIPVQPALPLGQLYADAQAAANGYVAVVDHPVLGTIRQPGTPVTMSPLMHPGAPVPPPDADRTQVLRPRVPAFPAAQPSEPDRPLLDGVRVVDFGNYLAGPLSTMLLADLGATVIKVEGLKGDPMRANGSAFLGCQRGKRSLSIDPARSEARPVIERLVRGADIVHHNIRLPTARRLGLTYDDLRALRPDIVFGHVSAYGPEGERRYWPGYDQLFQASAGWELTHAGEGNRPAWLRFGMMDHMCAASLAFGLLTALYRRNTTGEGTQVAASLLGTSIWTMADVALRADGTLTAGPAPLDADQTGPSPGRRLEQCADGWIALSGPDAAAPSPGAFAAMPVAQAMEQLSAGGFAVVAVPEAGSKTFLDDPLNQRLGLVASYDHAEFGRIRHPGAFWDFGGRPLRLDRAPPAMGQHSHEILSELGFTDAEIDALVRSGAVSVLQGEMAE